MRPYRAFFRVGGAAPVMVGTGFSWRVLVFGWFGLILHGAWIAGLLAGAVSLSVAALLPAPLVWALHLGMHVGLAVFTTEIRAWELRLNGAFPGPVVMAAGPRAALLRLIDRHPDVIAHAGSTAPGMTEHATARPGHPA